MEATLKSEWLGSRDDSGDLEAGAWRRKWRLNGGGVEAAEEWKRKWR